MAKFIVFEGLDNLGKTTQLELLKTYLKEELYVFTRCPGGTRLGEQIRNILIETVDFLKNSELLLFAISHVEATHRNILPALQSGKHVFCDRYYHSTLAYQSGLQGHSESDILLLHEKFCNNLQPDVVFYFTGEPLENEIKDNPANYDNVTIENRCKIHNMYEKYLGISGKFCGDVIPINVNNRSKEEIHAEILMHLRELDVLFDYLIEKVEASENGFPANPKTLEEFVNHLWSTSPAKGNIYITTKSRSKSWKFAELGGEEKFVNFPLLLQENLERVSMKFSGKFNYSVTLSNKSDDELEKILCYI